MLKRPVYKAKSAKDALIHLNGINAITNVIKRSHRKFPMFDILGLKPMDAPKGLMSTNKKY